MLDRVPLDNDIIKAYMKILNFGVHEIPSPLQATLETIDIPKQGGKWKVKGTGGVSKKPKHQRKPNCRPIVLDEDSEDHTHSDVWIEDTILHEEDNAHTYKVPQPYSDPFATIFTPTVSSPLASSIMIQPEADVFEN